MSAILAILEALEKQNKGIKAAEDNKSLLSALMDTNEYESKRQPSSRASYDTSTTGNVGMLGGIQNFAKQAGEEGLKTAIKDTAVDYAKSLDPTQELQEFIKKTKSGNTPTEKDVRQDAPKTGFLQQLGHSLIGKDDTPGEANKNVWGYAGESIGDLIRQSLKLSTTSDRTTQSPTEAYLSQIRDSLTSSGEPGTIDPIAQDRMRDPLASQTTIDNILNSPNNAFNEFRLGGAIPRVEYGEEEGSLYGKAAGQKIRNKEEFRRSGEFFDAKLGIETAKEMIPVKGEEKEAEAKLEAEQNLGRLEAAIGTNMDAWIDNISWNYDTYGVEPGGIIGGMTSKIAGMTRENPHWEGFRGSMVEYGAQNMRISVPGSRAIRGIKLFQESGPSDWSTIQSGVNNIANTMKSAIGKDVAVGVDDYIKEGFLPSDFKKLSPAKKFEAKQNYLRKVSHDYKKSFYSYMYEKNPKLVEESIINEYNLGDDAYSNYLKIIEGQ